MAKETKYLLADTDEEVLLGDVIVQTLVKNFSNGRRIEREVEFKLTEETLLPALDMGIIEEAEPENEEEENDELLDFSEDCPFKEMLDGVIEDQEVLEERVDKLEEKIKNKLDTIATLEDEIKKFKERQSSFLAKYYVGKAKENKTASSKKK
jgi:FtsZ-binding cell division protein ZapB